VHGLCRREQNQGSVAPPLTLHGFGLALGCVGWSMDGAAKTAAPAPAVNTAAALLHTRFIFSGSEFVFHASVDHIRRFGSVVDSRGVTPLVDSLNGFGFRDDISPLAVKRSPLPSCPVSTASHHSFLPPFPIERISPTTSCKYGNRETNIKTDHQAHPSRPDEIDELKLKQRFEQVVF
jgi:hypothetical protein